MDLMPLSEHLQMYRGYAQASRDFTHATDVHMFAAWAKRAEAQEAEIARLHAALARYKGEHDNRRRAIYAHQCVGWDTVRDGDAPTPHVCREANALQREWDERAALAAADREAEDDGN